MIAGPVTWLRRLTFSDEDYKAGGHLVHVPDHHLGRDPHLIRRWLDTEGRLHRDDGPAVIHGASGLVEWFVHGVRHRDKGPAIINSREGRFEWTRHGVRHRDHNQPAVIHPKELLVEWYTDGVLTAGADAHAWAVLRGWPKLPWVNTWPTSFRRASIHPVAESRSARDGTLVHYEGRGSEAWFDTQGRPHRGMDQPAIVQQYHTVWMKHGVVHRNRKKGWAFVSRGYCGEEKSWAWVQHGHLVRSKDMADPERLVTICY